jgi:hypothetical protein
VAPAVAQVEAVALQSGLSLAHQFYVQLVSAFIDGIQTPEASLFLSLLREQVDPIAPGRDQSSAWQATLDALHWAVLATLSDPDHRNRAMLLYFDAKQLLTESAVRRLAQRESRLKHHYMLSHTIGRSLNAAENFKQLADTIFRELPRLNIQACYVCIFEVDKPLAGPRLQSFGFNRQP